MTKQIVLKLNYKKFRQILDDLHQTAVFECDSRLVAFCLWYCHIYNFEKLEGLEKTRGDIVLEAFGDCKHKAKMKSFKRFCRWYENGETLKGSPRTPLQN